MGRGRSSFAPRGARFARGGLGSYVDEALAELRARAAEAAAADHQARKQRGSRPRGEAARASPAGALGEPSADAEAAASASAAHAPAREGPALPARAAPSGFGGAAPARSVEPAQSLHEPGDFAARPLGDALAALGRDGAHAIDWAIERGLRAIPADVRRRASGYDAGSIGILRADFERGLVRAPAQGSQSLPYVVVIDLGGPGWEQRATAARPTCTCPFSRRAAPCKHGVATMQVLAHAVKHWLAAAPKAPRRERGSSSAGPAANRGSPPAAPAAQSRWEALRDALDRAESALAPPPTADAVENSLLWTIRILTSGQRTSLTVAASEPRARRGAVERIHLSPQALLARERLLGRRAEPELRAFARRAARVEVQEARYGPATVSIECDPLEVVAALVGCPRVVWGAPDGPRLDVRERPLVLALVPDRASGATGAGGATGAARLVARIDDPRRPPSEVWLGDGFVIADPAGSTLTLYRCPAALDALAQAALADTALLPLELAAELVARLDRLAGAGAPSVHVDPALEGGSGPAGRALALRVEASGEARAPAGFDVRLGVRACPHGELLVPGEGASVLRVARDGRLVRLERDLAAERADADDALARLAGREAPAMPAGASDGRSAAPSDPARFRLRLDLVGALDLLRRARALEAEGALAVEAAADALPRVIGEIGPGALRVRLTSARDWLGIEGEAEVGGERVALAALLAALRAGERYVALGGGRYAALEEDLRRRLAPLEGASELAGPDARVGRTAAPLIDEALAGATVESVHPAWRVVQEALSRARAVAVEPPLELRADLRPYQREGFAWLKRLATWGVGAVLADDMGLGKTVQALALLLDRRALGPQLVIAPVSVASGWAREAERFAPGLKPRIYRDGGRRLDGLGAGDLVVATYELARADAEGLAAVTWASVVFDEAQKVKNAATKTAKALADIPAGFRLALTGTPIENHLGELWSLYRLVEPGLFGGWESFKARFAEPIEKRKDPARRLALAEAVRPYLLRRTKREVLADLPPREDVLIEVDLGPAERSRYESERLAAIARLTAPREAGAGQSGDPRFQVLAALVKLRQLACHPGLVDASWTRGSAKLDRVLELVAELRAEGHRALVFSQFTRLLARVRAAFDAAGVASLYLDGSTPARERARLVDAFQAGEGEVFLISLKAGGNGLNLTGADYVIHLDPWWNPAVEDQATDRAHRIGQTRPVTAMKLVAKGTVEERILALHDEKRELVASVLDGGEGAGKLSTDELLDLIRGDALDGAPRRGRGRAMAAERSPAREKDARAQASPTAKAASAPPKAGAGPRSAASAPPSVASTPVTKPAPLDAPALGPERLSGLALGRWMREQREARGWSRAALAKRAGVSEQAIYFYERGDRRSAPAWIHVLRGER